MARILKAQGGKLDQKSLCAYVIHDKEFEHRETGMVFMLCLQVYNGQENCAMWTTSIHGLKVGEPHRNCTGEKSDQRM